MCGVLVGVRSVMTRRGKMLFAVLDDGTAQVEIAVFKELYDQHRQSLREDQLIIVQGKVSNDDYTAGLRIVAEAIYDLPSARQARATSLCIHLNSRADAAHLRQMLHSFRVTPENGLRGVPVMVVYTKQQALCTVRLGEEWRVCMADALLKQLKDWAGLDGLEITYECNPCA
jgi:DNA polymerase-3 subunit alpha